MPDVRVATLEDIPAIRALLRAHNDDTVVDQFLASDPSLVDPSRLLPNPGML